MNNWEKLAILGTQDTGRRQAKTQHRKLKIWATWTPPKTKGEPRCSRRVRNPAMLLIYSWLHSLFSIWKTVVVKHTSFETDMYCLTVDRDTANFRLHIYIFNFIYSWLYIISCRKVNMFHSANNFFLTKHT